jgi:hypothetical protein
VAVEIPLTSGQTSQTDSAVSPGRLVELDLDSVAAEVGLGRAIELFESERARVDVLMSGWRTSDYAAGEL